MKYNVDKTAIYPPMDVIIDNITEYMLLAGIDIGRLYFHSLPMINVYGKIIFLSKTNNIGNILDELNNTEGDIIFNVNSQYCEYLVTLMMYDDLNVLDYEPIFDWSQDIKYVIIE